MATYLLVVLLIVSLLETSGAKIPEGNLKKTLDDILGHRQDQDMYQEMMRITHESREASDEDENRLRRIVGEDNLKFFQGGVSRRRGGAQLRSAVGRRRARSQALRREKLKSQSLRSHMQHTKRSFDYSSETGYL